MAQGIGKNQYPQSVMMLNHEGSISNEEIVSISHHFKLPSLKLTAITALENQQMGWV